MERGLGVIAELAASGRDAGGALGHDGFVVVFFLVLLTEVDAGAGQHHDSGEDKQVATACRGIMSLRILMDSRAGSRKRPPRRAIAGLPIRRVPR